MFDHQTASGPKSAVIEGPTTSGCINCPDFSLVVDSVDPTTFCDFESPKFVRIIWRITRKYCEVSIKSGSI